MAVNTRNSIDFSKCYISRKGLVIEGTFKNKLLVKIGKIFGSTEFDRLDAAAAITNGKYKVIVKRNGKKELEERDLTSVDLDALSNRLSSKTGTYVGPGGSGLRATMAAYNTAIKTEMKKATDFVLCREMHHIDEGREKRNPQDSSASSNQASFTEFPRY